MSVRLGLVPLSIGAGLSDECTATATRPIIIRPNNKNACRCRRRKNFQARNKIKSPGPASKVSVSPDPCLLPGRPVPGIPVFYCFPKFSLTRSASGASHLQLVCPTHGFHSQHAMGFKSNNASYSSGTFDIQAAPQARFCFPCLVLSCLTLLQSSFLSITPIL